MSAVTTRSTHHVCFQGAALVVVSDDELIAAAVARRLQICPVLPGPEADLRLEYLTGPASIDPCLPGQMRPVYDTPAGSVHYCPETDTISAQFGPVSLLGHPDAGAVEIRAEHYTPPTRYQAAHPLTMVALCELLKRRGRYPVHAAAVTGPGGAAVIAGPSGTGKSTLSLTLARTGLGFLSDDLVFLENESDGVRAYGFCDAIGVTPDTAARFPELADLVDRDPPPGSRKHLIRIEERFQATVVACARPRWLLFPELTGERQSQLEPLAGEEAWLRLVPDVLLTDPEATQQHLAALAALCEQTVCYRVCCGHDVAEAARLVRELVA